MLCSGLNKRVGDTILLWPGETAVQEEKQLEGCAQESEKLYNKVAKQGLKGAGTLCLADLLLILCFWILSYADDNDYCFSKFWSW